MRRGGRLWIVSGLAALVVVLVVGTAQAAQTVVSYSAGVGLRITGDDGVDRVRADVITGSTYAVSRLADPSNTGSNPLVASTGCFDASEVDDGNQITCRIAQNSVRLVRFTGNGSNDRFFFPHGLPADLSCCSDDVIADGGAGDDMLDGGNGSDLLAGGDGADDLDAHGGNDRLRGGSGRNRLEGGEGSDELEGGSGADVLLDGGGAGDDISRGNGGSDRFFASFSPDGADTYIGGGGIDEVSYQARSTPVTVRLDDSATTRDGFQGSPTEPAENDDVKPDVEGVTGGSAGDTLSDNTAHAEFAPVAAAELDGGPGDDTLTVGLLSPGATLRGGVGRDTVRGGPRSDAFRLVDGEQDSILDCDFGGTGATDSVSVDLRDHPIPENCESVDQGDRREGPNVVFVTRTARVHTGGRVRVRLRCPQRLGRPGCRGKLAAGVERRGRTRLGPRTRYRIRAGRTATVVVRLRRADRHARRPRLRLVSVEQGRHGPKTTRRVVPARR